MTESVEAYRLHPTVEARGSLLASLELYPNLSGVAREDPNPIESLASARDGGWLLPQALVVVEEVASAKFTAPDGYQELERRSYGDSELIFLQTNK